jgi:hypothetical protein
MTSLQAQSLSPFSIGAFKENPTIYAWHQGKYDE